MLVFCVNNVGILSLFNSSIINYFIIFILQSERGLFLIHLAHLLHCEFFKFVSGRCAKSIDPTHFNLPSFDKMK